MHREIIFRAYDPINKEMWAYVYPTWNGNVEGKKHLPSNGDDVELMPTDGDDQPILMQYTGYEDDNLAESVKVFEGDIIEWFEGPEDTRHTGEIFWPTFYKDEPGWNIRNAEMGFAYLFDNCSPRVIGNIYQNPDLLTASRGGSE